MGRSAPEVRNDSGWSSAGSGGVGGGPPFFSSVPLPARMWILFPRHHHHPQHHHHQAQNLIPGQMCCSGAQAWEPICVCVAALDPRKLSSPLVRPLLLWCSAKLSPAQLCWKCPPPPPRNGPSSSQALGSEEASIYTPPRCSRGRTSVCTLRSADQPRWWLVPHPSGSTSRVSLASPPQLAGVRTQGRLLEADQRLECAPQTFSVHNANRL